MSGTVGRNAKVAVSSADSSYTELGKIKSANLSGTNDRADSSNNDDAGWNTGEVAQKERSLAVTFVYDETDSGQEELRTAFEASAKLWFRFRPQASSGENEWRFQATVDDLNLNTEMGSIEESDFTATSDGAVTYAKQ